MPPQPDLASNDVNFKNLTSEQVAVNDNQFNNAYNPSQASANYASSGMPAGGQSSSNFGSRQQYGFQSASTGFNAGAQRGSSLIMNASSNDVTPETTNDDDKNEALISGKVETQEEINKRLFKPGYAYFVLFLTLLARIMVQW